MNYWIRPMLELNNVNKADKEAELIKRVCDLRNVSLADLKSKKRHRNIVESRFIVFYLLNEFCNYSLSETGAIFNKDHSTAYYGKTMIKDLMCVDSKLKSEVESLMDFVRYNFELPNSSISLKSRFAGVSWCRLNKKWRARRTKDGIRTHLGLFVSEIEASQAYQKQLNIS